MKSSSSTLSRSIGGVPMVLVAACGLTAVIAWTSTIHYIKRHNQLTSMSVTAYRRVKDWLRPVSNGKSIKAIHFHRSTSKDDNEPKIDENIDGKFSTSQRKSRFTTIEDTMIEDGGTLSVRPIGTIRSVYRLCVGTPRQGMLAPHARARIELHNIDDDRTGVAAAASVDGLQNFSHVWIVFIFHLNTVGKRKHSKIAPPALGGNKVGVLATRSPHRLNPIGMTLAKLDGIRTIPSSRTAEGRKQGAITILDISGSDLVDGTPVLDVKPYVPTYDAVAADACVVPEWVANGLSTARSVQFTERAESELRDIVWNHSERLEFYGGSASSTGSNTTRSATNDSVYESIKACIEEVLAVDVRSRHQTNKARLGLSRAEKADRMQQQQHQLNEPIPPAMNEDVCTQQLDNLLVSFVVSESKCMERVESIGSGAEDIVFVQSIHLLDVM